LGWLFSLALKNLRRNLRRTLISSIAVVAGVAIMIVGTGVVNGLNEGVIRAQINSQSGHLDIRPPGFEHGGVINPVDTLVPLPAAVSHSIKDYTVAHRLLFDARVIAGADAIRGLGVGYTDSDSKVFLRDSQDLQGQWSEDAQTPGLVLGKGLAALLQLKLGDRVTLETRTTQGALNAMSWPLIGIVHAHNPAVDNFAVFLPMDQAQSLVASPGPSQIAIRLSRRSRADSLAVELQSQMPEGWTVESYSVAAEALMEINKIREKALRLMIFIILAIAATGIANTVIMSVYERIREVGTLAAMGMPPAQIRSLFLMEGAAMGLCASIVGACLGAKVNHYFSTVGFDVGNLPDASSRVPFSTTIYTSFSTPMVFVAVGFGVSVAVLASIWPARFAATLDPATAVRED
jgi:putative ABC transport system permease protein